MIKELAVIILVFCGQFNIFFTGSELTGSVFNSLKKSGEVAGADSRSKNKIEIDKTRINKTDKSRSYSAPAFSQIGISDDNDFEVKSKSAIAVNAETGAIIYEKNIREKLPVASLAKLTTALVVLDKVDLESQATISGNAVATEGNKGNLKTGEKITVRNLLCLLLVNSSNDAATALAEHISGSEDGFVKLMNKKAKALGLENTSFANPTGLDQENNYSTAYDLTKLVKIVLNEPLLLEIMRIQDLDVFSVDGVNVHHLSNTNKLLGKLPGINIIGGKTGFTNQAEECLILITVHPENNQRIISVILGSEDRFGEMEKLINWIYGNKS